MACVALALGGCWNSDKTVRYDDLYGKSVLVTVNGTDLLKAKLERDVALRVALVCHRNSRITQAQVEKLKKSLYAGAIENFVRKEAYKSLSRELRVFAGVNDLEEARKRFLRTYLRGQAATWEKFVAKFDRELLSGLEQDLAFEALKIKVDAKLKERLRTEPSPSEISELMAKHAAYNARAAKENAAIYQNATNLWRQIVADPLTNAFEAAVAKYAEGHEHMTTDASWGAFSLAAFEGERALGRLIPTMKVGDVTPPVEGDNGLVILKLLRVDSSSGGEAKADRQYTFAKIFFELPEFFEELGAEQLGKAIAADRAEKAAKDAVAARIKSMKVSYPNGKVVFP